MPEIPALSRLQELPELINENGFVTRPGQWGSASEHDEYMRRSIETLTFAEMDANDLYLFMYRATYDATRAWERTLSFWGRIYNRFAFDRPGYVKINGRVLLQALNVLNDDKGMPIEPGTDWYLRLDLAMEIRDLLKPLAKGVA